MSKSLLHTYTKNHNSLLTTLYYKYMNYYNYMQVCNYSKLLYSNFQFKRKSNIYIIITEL